MENGVFIWGGFSLNIFLKSCICMEVGINSNTQNSILKSFYYLNNTTLSAGYMRKINKFLTTCFVFKTNVFIKLSKYLQLVNRTLSKISECLDLIPSQLIFIHLYERKTNFSAFS